MFAVLKIEVTKARHFTARDKVEGMTRERVGWMSRAFNEDTSKVIINSHK